MSPPTPLEKATRERDTSNRTVEYLEKKVADHATTPLNEFKIDQYLATVDVNITKIDEVFQRIVAIVDPAQMATHQTEYEQAMDKAVEVKSQLLTIKRTIAPQPPPSPGRSNGHGTDIRLPKLTLPIFEGKIEEWTSFRDMFVTAIDSNPSLSKSQKLTYLKAQLKGEAARQVQSLIITDDNYDIAWQQLSDRYQNDRQLLFALLKRFVNQQGITNPTATTLRQLVDTSNECIRSLEVMKQPVKQWDSILLYLIYQKLDSSTRELYEQSLKDSSVPKLKGLFDFVEQRSRALEAGGCKSTSSTKANDKPKQMTQRSHVHHAQSSSSSCECCHKDNHPLYRCSSFLSMGVKERQDFTKKKNLCNNCLRNGHFSSQCPSASTCRSCGGKHHSLIHMPRPQAPPAPAAVSTDSKLTLSHHTKFANAASQTLLATATILIKDFAGIPRPVRALLDGGSDTHIISKKCIKRLGLKYRKNQALVTGLSMTPVGSSPGEIDLDFTPHFDASTMIQAKNTRIMPTVTTKLPIHPCNPDMPHLNGIQLADKSWYIPDDVDMLIGASLFYGLITGERKTGKEGQPFALNSDLGWLIVGNVGDDRKPNHFYNSNVKHVNMNVSEAQPVTVSNADLDRRLKTFWELESTQTQPAQTTEEKAAEEHFVAHTTQQADGRYVVKLPFKSCKPDIGPSRQIAINRLKQLERRLVRVPEYRKEYNQFMKEYVDLGHMQEVPEDEINSDTSCYIPHHFVLKECSTTTSFRVVFDAKSKTANGRSLNESLMVGPTIQDSLFSILLRFRTHIVAFTADIAKMYRQIKVTKEDADFQRIVWREDPSKPIRDYRLLTVTYGTASAPFLATRVLQELARNQQVDYPLAFKVCLNDFYVDDMMSGADSVPEAQQIQSELLSLMKKGCLELRKWSSSHKELVTSLPMELRETKSVLPMELGQTVKALGIYWSPESDQFFFRIEELSKKTQSYTKRTVLSDIAKIFDPIGWIAPVVITAKIFMQDLWKLSLDWDDPLPLHLHTKWIQFRSDLKQVEKIRIPRCVKHSPDSKFALIGFCDASEKAYAGVVYLAVYPDDRSPPLVSLIASKTRVAPCKTVSIPRLELCGAVLLSYLMESVQSALSLNIHHVSAWTDSMVVLAWIRSHPSKWKRFVANRVTEVQERISSSSWGHVSGVDNPADCASRGMDPSTLNNFTLWWTGPQWLQDGIPAVSIPQLNIDNKVDLEERSETTCLRIQLNPLSSILRNFSSLLKLKRTTAWIFRYVHNLRTRKSLHHGLTNEPSCEHRPGEETRVGSLASRECGLGSGRSCVPSRVEVSPLLPEELDKAMLFWVRTIQQHEFFGEINALQEQKPIPRNSQILSLNPFIDADGLLRVGGRIHKAPTNYNLRHPVLLPRHSHLTKLIIDDIHMRHYHAGPQLVQSLICQKFWIIRARDAIRHQIRKCVTCVKQRASTMQQQMANLPESRVTPSRPFTRCGVDYAGPFLLKPMLSRSKTTIKSYLCLFVCFSTRALHLELVSSLSTEAFIAALRRFVARRGKPSDIFSDCGTNFIGADRQLRELVALYSNPSHNSQVSDQLSQDGIKWHFNPPGAPSFGGLWEAGVKSVKFHLRRIIGSNRLNFEEMTTIITQVEAVLNSRPITALSSDPSDMTALTPGHFLIGGPLVAAPDQDLTDEKFSRLNRWQMLQQMYQSFWKRWYREFLTRMQQRPKWMEPQPQIQVDDLVIIKEDNLPPLQWKLGRVQDVHPGDDGIVRVVTLRTKDGNLKRPILKLCLLPVGKLEGLTNNSEVLKRPSSVQSGGNDDALNIHP